MCSSSPEMAAPMSATACPTKASSRASSIGLVSVVVMSCLLVVGCASTPDAHPKRACRAERRTSVPATDRTTESRQSVLGTDALAAAYAAGWTGNDAGVPASPEGAIHDDLSRYLGRVGARAGQHPPGGGGGRSPGQASPQVPPGGARIRNPHHAAAPAPALAAAR